MSDNNYMEGFNPKEYFNGKCPYTDKPCDSFKCDTCEVEAEERKQTGRYFESIKVECDKNGKPYYSIMYVENGERFNGYGTYKIDVLSRYIRDYFIYG